MKLKKWMLSILWVAAFNSGINADFVTTTNLMNVAKTNGIIKKQEIYYVSPDGNDNNKGSFDEPFKTIQKAADIMEVGNICYIRKGIYRECITLKKNGDKKQPITFCNYKDEVVIITENRVVNNWQHYQGNIYRTYCPDSTAQVFCNHQESPLASYPNITNKLTNNEWANAYSDSTGKVVFKGKHFSKDYWNGAICRILTGEKWVAAIGNIHDCNDSAVQVSNKKYPLSKYSKKSYLGGGKAYITNHFNALDTAYEWIWQNDSLYYFVPQNQDIQSLLIETRSSEFGLVADNRKNIKVIGLHFFAASISFKNAENCLLESGSVQYPSLFRMYGSGWTSSNGVFVSGEKNKVDGVYVAHSWGDGITLQGKENTVENCLIEDCDWMLVDGAAIKTHGIKLNVLNNTCHETGRSVISHGSSPKIRIINNHLYNGGMGTNDLGITYSNHTNGDGAELAYNWMHDNKANGVQKPIGTGIYLDNQDTAFIIHHNVVWNCEHGIQTNKDAVNHQVYNNTIFNCTDPMHAWGPNGTAIYGQKVYNNLSEVELVEGNDFKNNVIESKEQLKDIAHLNFIPKKQSKAINGGIFIEGITKECQGKSPTAGAYQYGEKPWIPGSTTKEVGNLFKLK